MSDELSLSPTTLAFGKFLILIIAILFVIRFIQWIFRDETIMDEIIDSFSMEDICLKTDCSVYLSVIYVCNDDAAVIREQITCLSHVIARALGRHRNYEFICLTPTSRSHTLRDMDHLCDQIEVMNSYVINVDSFTDTTSFLIGSCFAKGRFIINARYVASEIDNIKPINKPLVVFAEAPDDISSSIPILGTKSAVMIALSRCHFTGPGSAREMMYLCHANRIRYNFHHYNFGSAEKSQLWRLMDKTFEKIMEFMYEHNYWRVKTVID